LAASYRNKKVDHHSLLYILLHIYNSIIWAFFVASGTDCCHRIIGCRTAPQDLENEEEEEEEKKVQQRHRMPSAFDLIDSGSGVQTDVSFPTVFLLTNSL
jgi:hypothetical protein